MKSRKICIKIIPFLVKINTPNSCSYVNIWAYEIKIVKNIAAKKYVLLLDTYLHMGKHKNALSRRLTMKTVRIMVSGEEGGGG